jgi:hypothetical protein
MIYTSSVAACFGSAMHRQCWYIAYALPMDGKYLWNATFFSP